MKKWQAVVVLGLLVVTASAGLRGIAAAQGNNPNSPVAVGPYPVPPGDAGGK